MTNEELVFWDKVFFIALEETNDTGYAASAADAALRSRRIRVSKGV